MNFPSCCSWCSILKFPTSKTPMSFYLCWPLGKGSSRKGACPMSTKQPRQFYRNGPGRSLALVKELPVVFTCTNYLWLLPIVINCNGDLVHEIFYLRYGILRMLELIFTCLSVCVHTMQIVDFFKSIFILYLVWWKVNVKGQCHSQVIAFLCHSYRGI